MHFEAVNENLFAEFPALLPALDEMESGELDDEDLENQYYIAGRFVDFLRIAYENGDWGTYEKGLLFIEKLHLSDCHETGELATVGYLESFLDWDKNDVLMEDLGEESKKWWLELNRFWSGKVKYIGQSFES